MRQSIDKQLSQQDGICFLCLERCVDPTIEHVIPLRRGKGGSLPKKRVNQVAACRHCNAAKGNRPPTEVEMARLLLLHRQAKGEAERGAWMLVR